MNEQSLLDTPHGSTVRLRTLHRPYLDDSRDGRRERMGDSTII